MKRKKLLAALVVLALLVGLLPTAAYAADPAQGGETPEEEARGRLNDYITSIRDNQLDGLLTEDGETALGQYKLAVEQAKRLLVKNPLTSQNLQTIYALLGFNGTEWKTKNGELAKLGKKVVVKMEIEGDKTKLDPHSGKQYTTVNPANGTIIVKTPVTGLVKDDDAPRRLYLNAVKKTDFDNATDSTTGATPTYPKEELDAQYYTVEDKGNGTYEIHLHDVPADFVILKPVIKVTFASETKAENGGMVFTQTTITEDDVPVTDLAKDYNGEAQKPTFGGQLVPDRDYTVSYSGSGLGANEKPKNPGTYTVTVTGKGNYTGNFTKTFTIKKVGREAPTGFRPTPPTAVGALDGKIQGTTTAMEFRKQGVQDWTPCTEPELQGLPAGTYEIRYKTTATQLPSKPAIVEVTNPGAPPVPQPPAPHRPAPGGNYVPDLGRTPERMDIPAENGKENGYVQAPAGSVDPSTRLRVTEKANGKRDVILVDANGNQIYSSELMLVTIPAPKGQQGSYRVKVNGVYTTFELSEDGKYVTMPVVFSRDGKMSEDVIVRQGGVSVTGTYKALPGMYKLSVTDRGNTRFFVNLTDASGKKVHSNGPVMVSIPAPQGVGEVYRVRVDGKWTTFEVKDGMVRFAMVF